MSVSRLRSCCTNSPLPFETYNLWTSALEWRIFGIRRSFNFFARRLSTAHFSTLVGSGDHFHFINHSPLTRDLQTFLLFSQHLTWVITPPNQNSVFYGLTSAIKHTFITNQGTRRSQLYNCSWPRVRWPRSLWIVFWSPWRSHKFWANIMLIFTNYTKNYASTTFKGLLMNNQPGHS